MIYTSLLGWLLVAIAIALIILKNPLKLRKTFLPIYFVMLLITFFCYLYSVLGTKVLILDFIGSLWVYIAFGFVLMHSSLLLGKKKTTILIILALILGLVSELVGVNFGWIFGNYFYNPMLSPFLFGSVPLMTVVSWAIIIYMSYTLTNIVLRGFKTEKPNMKRYRFFYVILLIIILSSIDGLIATNLDMILDPVSVSLGGWFWIDGGPYAGIPISNFVGWFFVTFSATFIFRFYESFNPVKESTSKESLIISSSIIVLYLMYFLLYSLQALIIGNPVLVLIGVTTMGPFILITTMITLITFLSKGDMYDR